MKYVLVNKEIFRCWHRAATCGLVTSPEKRAAVHEATAYDHDGRNPLLSS